MTNFNILNKKYFRSVLGDQLHNNVGQWVGLHLGRVNCVQMFTRPRSYMGKTLNP